MQDNITPVRVRDINRWKTSSYMFYAFPNTPKQKRIKSLSVSVCLERQPSKSPIRSGLKHNQTQLQLICLFIVFYHTMFWPQPFSFHVYGTHSNLSVCVRACAGPRLCVPLFTGNKTHTTLAISSTECSDVRITNTKLVPCATTDASKNKSHIDTNFS